MPGIAVGIPINNQQGLLFLTGTSDCCNQQTTQLGVAVLIPYQSKLKIRISYLQLTLIWDQNRHPSGQYVECGVIDVEKFFRRDGQTPGTMTYIHIYYIIYVYRQICENICVYISYIYTYIYDIYI
jgi:hypothetical protein